MVYRVCVGWVGQLTPLSFLLFLSFSICLIFYLYTDLFFYLTPHTHAKKKRKQIPF